MSEIRSVTTFDTGSDGDVRDPAALLQELLGDVHTVVGQLTQERDQQRIHEEDLRQWLTAAQDRARELDRKLDDARTQIRELSEQLVLAREHATDSTRQLAEAQELAANATRRLVAAQEQILILSPSNQQTPDVSEGDTVSSDSKQRHRRVPLIPSSVLVTPLVIVAIVLVLNYTNLSLESLPYFNHSSPPSTVQMPPAHGPTVRSSTSGRAFGSLPAGSLDNPQPTVGHQPVPPPHSIQPHVHMLGAGLSQTHPVAAAPAVCLHGCQALIKGSGGAFVIKKFANERAYTNYIRRYHVFVEYADALNIGPPLKRHANAFLN